MGDVEQGRCRQGNYAAYVTLILPLSYSSIGVAVGCIVQYHEANYQVHAGSAGRTYLLDAHNHCYGLVTEEAAHGSPRRRGEDASAAGQWCVELQPNHGHRSRLPQPSVLRSARPGPDQVRDAAP